MVSAQKNSEKPKVARIPQELVATPDDSCLLPCHCFYDDSNSERREKGKEEKEAKKKYLVLGSKTISPTQTRSSSEQKSLIFNYTEWPVESADSYIRRFFFWFVNLSEKSKSAMKWVKAITSRPYERISMRVVSGKWACILCTKHNTWDAL